MKICFVSNLLANLSLFQLFSIVKHCRTISDMQIELVRCFDANSIPWIFCPKSNIRIPYSMLHCMLPFTRQPLCNFSLYKKSLYNIWLWIEKLLLLFDKIMLNVHCVMQKLQWTPSISVSIYLILWSYILYRRICWWWQCLGSII